VGGGGSSAFILKGQEDQEKQMFTARCDLSFNIIQVSFVLESAVAQWLRCCATNRKVAGSIPDGVIGIFH